ncbi:MAG: ADP-ribosyl-[dinitrogen reductase] hydrolase [Calditerrivibrio sp.]|nr:ADP-ribosyl-[dinitrogen reductase] hydrolase [Calditerrivibrio sp.]
MKNFLNRAIAAYIGFAIGDAFGATTEFMTPNEIRSKYGVLRDIVGGGWLNLKPGEVTDDTGLCLALGNSILYAGGYDTVAAAESFVEWMKSKPVDIGNSTRLGILRYMKKKILYANVDEYSAGNGGLMRVLPLIIYSKGDVNVAIEMAQDQSRITHNNQLSDTAIGIYCHVLNELLLSGDKLSALKVASDCIKKHHVFSFSRYKGENSGYVVDTLRSVLHFYFDGNGFEDTLISTVNNGGDADTIGALTGALAGATYGVDAIPKRWVKKINKQLLSLISLQTILLVGGDSEKNMLILS